MTSLQYLIFDLGSVLVEVDLDRGDRALSELSGAPGPTALAGEASPPAQPGVKAFRNGEAYQAFLVGRLTPEGFHRAFLTAFKLQPKARAPSLAAFRAAWNRYLAGPVAGMEGLLERLGEGAARGDGGPELALLSNTEVWHLRWCEAHLPALVHIPPARRFASCGLGLAKPDPAIYLDVARRLGTVPDRCLMVDDLAENVAGARRAGMEGLRFCGAEELAATLKERGLL